MKVGAGPDFCFAGREGAPPVLLERALSFIRGKVKAIVRISFPDLERKKRSFLVDCERSFLLAHELGGSSLLLSVGWGSSVLSC